jgi:hypothetical protein
MSIYGKYVDEHFRIILDSIHTGKTGHVEIFFKEYYIEDNAYIYEEMHRFYQKDYYDAYLLASILDGGRLCSDLQMILIACIAFEYGLKGGILAGSLPLPSLKTCFSHINVRERNLLKDSLSGSFFTPNVQWRIDYVLKTGSLELNTRIFKDNLSIHDFLICYNTNVYCILPDIYNAMSENIRLCAHFFAECSFLCRNMQNADVFMEMMANLLLDDESDDNLKNRERYRNVLR